MNSKILIGNTICSYNEYNAFNEPNLSKTMHYVNKKVHIAHIIL